jgi:ABC-type phosphate/phosphonate transport system permease subunit
MNPPKGLLEKILKRIHREERFFIIRRLGIFSVTLLGSIIAFIPVLKMLLSDFAKSGFFNFFSLAFSDFSTVASYWQNFTVILLETLPIISLVLFLAVILVFLQSVKSLTKNILIYGTK